MTYEGLVALNGLIGQEEWSMHWRIFQKVGKGSLRGLGPWEEKMAGDKARDFETHETLEAPA